MTKDDIIRKREDARKSWAVLVQTQYSREKVWEAKERTRHTTDVHELYQRNGHLVFVYGSLKAPLQRNHILKQAGAEFLAVGVSYNKYSMYYQPGPPDLRFPIILPPDGDQASGEVVGQIWLVRPSTIITLDNMEKNGDLFHRFRMSVQVISKPTTTDLQQYSVEKCWAYLGAACWKALIPSNDILPVPKSKLFSDSDKERFLNWSPKLAGISPNL